ncbi:hypothetical protein M513_08977 [Trichuris suis]|uniref:Peptidase S1 domain-containing protein n=1 Tax=Trichuris suis TaxID=68888 RepID=A0A085LYU2_9BILA|nr:hypothetical protein M513_08977 [Trichuris suis]
MNSIELIQITMALFVCLGIAFLLASVKAEYECGVPYFSIQKYNRPYTYETTYSTTTARPTSTGGGYWSSIPTPTLHYPSQPSWSFDSSNYPLWFSFGRRIVGGWEARPHSIPWQVRLMRQISSYQYTVCGGSLIQPFQPRNGTQFVLTAAHCLYTEYGYAATNRLKVLVGAHDLNSNNEASQMYIGVKNYMHHSYNDDTKENDIAVLQLQRYVAYTSYTRPVCLPKPNEAIPQNAYCFVSGWGKTSEEGKSSTLLRMVDVAIIPDSECYVHDRLQQMVFCAGTLQGGKDSCQGDSGGPLVCEVNGQYYQYGVVSFGAGCARVGYPGVYARVPTYINWTVSGCKSMEAASTTTWEESGNRGMEIEDDPSKEKEYYDNFFVKPEHLESVFKKIPDFDRPSNNYFGLQGMQTNESSECTDLWPGAQEIARRFALEFELTGFQASSGRLEKFMLRHKISQKILCGESNEVPVESMVNAYYECGIPAFPVMKRSPNERIVNGWEARPHSLPWQVRITILQPDGKEKMCGGSLIQLKGRSNATIFVLTAAHCLLVRDVYMEPRNVKVLAGAHDLRDHYEMGRSYVRVRTYTTINYNSDSKENDIALLILQYRIPYSEYARPVCLPTQGESLPVGSTCFVSGWGTLWENGPAANLLQMVDVEILDDYSCYVPSSKRRAMFCAGHYLGNKDSCQGDSGSPLVCMRNGQYYQYGIASFGIGCGRPYYPGIYTNVKSYTAWMQREAENLNQEIRATMSYEPTNRDLVSETQESAVQYVDDYFVDPAKAKAEGILNGTIGETINIDKLPNNTAFNRTQLISMFSKEDREVPRTTTKPAISQRPTLDGNYVYYRPKKQSNPTYPWPGKNSKRFFKALPNGT